MFQQNLIISISNSCKIADCLIYVSHHHIYCAQQSCKTDKVENCKTVMNNQCDDVSKCACETIMEEKCETVIEKDCTTEEEDRCKELIKEKNQLIKDKIDD